MENTVIASSETPVEERVNSPLDTVVNYIRLGVREGRLVPGQRLIEPELVRKLSVSRGTVREALVHLQGEGIVEFERYRGGRIRILTRQKVLELNQIRGVVEGLAARLAAERIDGFGEAQLLSLHPPLDEASRDYQAYNERLHSAIIGLSGNESVPKVVSATLLETFRLQFSKLLMSPEQIELSYGAHERIVRAILARDGAEAERQMVRHVAESCEAILEAPEYYFE